MKKINIYILCLTAFIAGACGDNFLETEPMTDLTDGNFYRTPDDANKALVGCYDGLQVVWAGGISFPVASEVLSDNTFGGTGFTDGYGYQMLDEFDKTRSTSDQNLFSANWTAYYKGIYRCNVLLSKMDQINWGSNTALRSTYEAEARFIRAYLYFDMVRLWGNIPLLTEPSSENLAQSTPEEVYKTIAEDLKFAADNLPEVTYAQQATGDRGRVTKWAAEALIGRAYLYYTGYYGKTDLAGVITKTDALNYLENVISKSGHALVDDFAKLWPAASVANYAGEDNIETVFAIKYTYTSDYDGNTDGNHWMVMCGIRDLIYYPYGQGWGACTVNPKLWSAYSSTDTRRAASIISIGDENIPYDKQGGQREYTGYYGKKYSPMSYPNGTNVGDSLGVNFQIGQFQDYVSIRYSDVLLMAAELGSSNAQQYFDDVRKRAYKTNFVSESITQAGIMEERRLEFALEGIRYWDLLRQGVNTAASTIAETAPVLNGGASATKTISASKILETQGLQQIPYTQVTLSSGVLKQNIGW